MWILLIIFVFAVPYIAWSICQSMVMDKSIDMFKQYRRAEYRGDYNRTYCRHIPSPDQPFNREDY